ncbi:MAG TPA: hypothetical protein VFU44_08590 [Candidatus Limnocylindria bacterium]|nr:hypothetical protein [Candidatus Limnocylindria bacterium]
MTEVNGLRLAYRGFVAGLAGGYIWVAIAMTLSAIMRADPLLPLRPLALAVTPLAGSSELAFVIGLMAVQAAGALVGMCFAYFFARFFTVTATLRIAAPAVALLAWALIAATADVTPRVAAADWQAQIVPLIATLGYAVLLGAWVPVRGEVIRQAGSPST